MAYIDPDGMFGGDRMARLSDSAKMAWPWFWCASNTVGRVELNYREFVTGPFRQFKAAPAETQFWEWIAEFHEAFLMFVYEVNGQVWGQWFVTEKYLPTYKTVNDKKTPAPIALPFVEWKNRYTELKVSLISGKCRVLTISETFQGAPKVSGEPENSGEPKKFHMGVERKGEERRGEEEPKPCSSDDERGEVLFALGPPIPRKGAQPKQPLTTQQVGWFAEWWAIYWRTGSKKDAVAAFGKHVKTEERFQQVMIATRLQSAMMLGRDEHKRPLGATWLNGERWDDPTCEARASPSLEQDASLMRVIGNLERMHGKHL